MMKKTISLLLILCMLVSFTAFSAAAQDTEISDTGAVDYGLGETIQDGNILHCFCWTLNQIKAELPNIAAAGFTSVQTSPLQAHNGRNQWYWLYQPNGFSTIGNEIGSYSDLQALCTEADKYGIKIIVDVVANHVAGGNGNPANSVESILKKNEYYHKLGSISDYSNRYEVTQKDLGMPDLNSEHQDIQDMTADMITRLKDAGVDGIRWDAAKHIALPSEGCDFWTEMADIDIFQYGEILGKPAGDSADSVNDPLMKEYADLISVTDTEYSSALMRSLMNGTTYKTAGYWNRKGISADKLIYWGESHDTYSNSGSEGWTKNLDQNDIDRVYALVGARAGSQALYFSRPSEKNKESIYYAKKGSTHFMSNEVAAVNRFHNAMNGTADKFSYSGGCYVVWREGGAVIVSSGDGDIDVEVNNSSSMVPVGTYVDEVSGSTFTVTDKKISGHIGDTGIAVIYGEMSTGEEYIVGDADGDGEVSILDATWIQRVLIGIGAPADFNEAAADVDGDGEMTIIDATYIQRYLVGIDVPYAVGETVSG